MLKNIWSTILTLGAKFVLLAITPLATSLYEENSIILNQEVISILKKHKKFERFKRGYLFCKNCNSQLSINNLGFLRESPKLEMTCDNPGCTLKI